MLVVVTGQTLQCAMVVKLWECVVLVWVVLGDGAADFVYIVVQLDQHHRRHTNLSMSWNRVGW